MSHALTPDAAPTPAPPLRLILVGAGGRGTTYATYAATTGRARIVAIAEPDVARATAARERHPGAEVFDDWRALAEQAPEADAVLITTQDVEHVEPAVRFAELGYHILLEKPMATSEEDARQISDAVAKAGVMLAVCHVLRYTPYTTGVKEIVDSGRLGDIVSVEHLEPVGWWHQAHSYVRGNWRREDQASPMLLAKSSHDLDWISYIIGAPVRKVSSFGSLMHFRPENRPAEAADNCLDCPVESTCPYSAKRLYLGCLGDADRERWPLNAVTEARTPDGIEQALREGPYGRCVYACDNDVVDHQVVNLEYEGGATASFTMTAFTPFTHRKTRIFGTLGSLDGDGVHATVTDFVTGREETLLLGVDGPDAGSGHGGGDERLVDAFLDALTSGDPAHILSDPVTSLESHLVAWAAERARRTDTVQALAN
ncbi:oxidoreductase [Kitasatospora herbaricolor]|uniref:Gfo/Idh/MocA family protein n=1 Tax=Kitasatospora herbaricolor TaxID=68217 RepID=UPI00174D91EB|nr:Gfo/Idh/MocA family oxidoreductase [Kitasatospora herbaricolor]MDQ0312594.1 putative dehydrogenase [Kitasatospora herbaricolor]GGV29745.1 oxidoreductase [Kitasatospora herbaricolor]